MKAFTGIKNLFDQKVEAVSQYLQRLSVRERVMVVFTAIFLTVVIIGSALWKMHSLADQQQTRLNELKDLTVWMQSNAATMKPANDLDLTPADKIQRTAQQQGLAVSSQQSGEQIQIVAEHQNYAVLANFLMQLSQMGLSIQKMEMVSNNNQIKLSATVE
ncbi:MULTISPECIES: type II secretion system protein GspM [Acinetobacter]|jgi:general secretion pathway protein M|uniref:type II secretion system protein GspM n=1 Tax=Acinetobacter TaxID=469 RepID=UPI000C48BD08|nr:MULTISPECIES: type II secretion system protein GspM [Acinetobacter]MDA0695142.1 type II secretion system protein GspM [Pseudomonadota bacterium]MBC70192.1 type II secretion system protein M [Acinetobacter sp.]MBT48958.1 type II secretion system protein M [Acinetobacter sp.]MCR4530406.1 type II secretion system protein M [Acinetobacter venetianus]MDA1255212.1 type II secretion system protein GspM [Pseudomonadota bacterium]|tara:strand:+ start:366 stop:845 length:480 start_codon:yes stop_codon:yes gene_type:complete